MHMRMLLLRKMHVLPFFRVNLSKLTTHNKCISFIYSSVVVIMEITLEPKKSAGVLAKANYIFTTFPSRCTNAYPSFHKPNEIWWLLRMEETPSQYLFYQLIAACQLHLALVKNEAIESFIKHSSCDCSRALLKSMKHCCLRDVSLTSFLKKIFFLSCPLL